MMHADRGLARTHELVSYDDQMNLHIHEELMLFVKKQKIDGSRITDSDAVLAYVDAQLGLIAKALKYVARWRSWLADSLNVRERLSLTLSNARTRDRGSSQLFNEELLPSLWKALLHDIRSILLHYSSKRTKRAKLTSGAFQRGNKCLQDLFKYFNAGGQGIPLETLTEDTSELFNEIMNQ